MLVAFGTGFTIRVIPETRTWPYPIGWDTIGYIAYLRDFLTKFNPFTEYLWLGVYRHVPPLMAIILAIPSMFIDPWYLLKLWGPIIYGFIAALAAYIANKMLGDKPNIPLATGLIATLHVVTLGSSQQWHRHILWILTTLFFIATTTRKEFDRGKALSLMVTAMAYEPTAALAFLLSMYQAIMAKGARKRMLYTIVTFLSLLLLIWYIMVPLRPHPIAGITIVGIDFFFIPWYGQRL